mgnify:CR=1 FL=1
MCPHASLGFIQKCVKRPGENHDDDMHNCRNRDVNQGQAKNLGIILAEVKSFDSARFGHKVIYKHLPDTPFFMADDINKRMKKAFGEQIAIWSENENTHLLMIATFSLGESGAPQIEELSLMIVSEHWIPFDNLIELGLINDMVREQRSFIKGMRYNLSSETVIANAVLTDAGDQPLAIYMIPPGSEESYYEDLQKLQEDSSIPSYIWDVNAGEALSLPIPLKHQAPF